MKRSAHDRLRGSLMLLAGSLGVCWLIGELALRARIGPPIRWKHPQESYQADPEGGYRLVPGQVSSTHDQAVFVNSLGLRAAEVPRAAPPTTERIIALGDSQTFGLGLPLADTWPGQLELALNQGGGLPRWEVLNAGLPASDTCHQVGILQRLLRELEFDGVVLGFYVNDVACLLAAAPFALDSTRGEMRRVLYALKRSAVFTAIWQARAPLWNWLRPDPGFGHEQRVLDGTPDPSVEAGWGRVTGFLREIKASLDARGIRFTILVIPRRDQVQDSRAPTAYNQRIAAIAADLGVQTVDALEALREAYQIHGEALFIPWDGHDSRLANLAISQLLAATLATSPD